MLSPIKVSIFAGTLGTAIKSFVAKRIMLKGIQFISITFASIFILVLRVLWHDIGSKYSSVGLTQAQKYLLKVCFATNEFFRTGR